MPPKKQLEKVIQEYEFSLSPVNDPKQLTISVKGSGKHAIGRGNLTVKDSRISREHCEFEIKIDEETKCHAVFINRKGLNPLFVTRREKVHSVEEPFLLEEGDLLSLLPSFVEKPHTFIFSTESSKKRKPDTTGEVKKIEINLVDDEKTNKRRKIEFNLTEDDDKKSMNVDIKKSNDPSETEKADRELALKYQPKECTLCLEELDFEFFSIINVWP